MCGLRSALAVTLTSLVFASSAHALLISEVLFDPVAFGSDAGLEFIEIFNDTNAPIDLADWSLGWGTTDYTAGTLDLDAAGVLAPDEFIVIGGPDTDVPSITSFTPELPNGFFTAGGVALFELDAAAINASTVPDDAVIYTIIFGFNNSLLDPTGAVGPVMANATNAGETVGRDLMGNWIIEPVGGSPGTGLIPEPSTALLVGLGLAFLGARRRL